jgi:hypothetical protein
VSIFSPPEPPRFSPGTGDCVITAQHASLIVVAGAAVIASAAIGPAPLRVLSALTALVVPGWSVVRLAFGRSRLDRSTVCVLAIGISVAILIGISLLLNILGVIDRSSVAVSLALFELLIGVAMLVRLDAEALPQVETSNTWRSLATIAKQRLRTWCAIVAAVGSIAAGVAVVHLTGPSRAEPPFAALSYAGAPAATIRSLAPGARTIDVKIDVDSPLKGVVIPSIDGVRVGNPVTVRVTHSRTIPLDVVVPSLTRCRHQLSVVFTSDNKSTTLHLIGYVTGLLPSRCTGQAPAGDTSGG